MKAESLLKLSSVSIGIFFQLLLSSHAREIYVLSNSGNFIENRQTTFVCSYARAPKNVSAVWFVRDPVTKCKTFYTNGIIDQTDPKKFDGKNRRIFWTLLMRRDFSHLELVCRFSDGTKKVYRLPEVKSTIPAEVKFLSKNLVRGEPLRLECDVKGNEANVKEVFFREPNNMIRAQPAKRIEPGWIRYAVQYRRKVLSEFDSVRIQCVANIVDRETSASFQVASRITTLTVHYVEFQIVNSTSYTTIRSKNLTINFQVISSPTPAKNHFEFEAIDGQKIEFAKPMSVEIYKQSKNIYNVTTQISFHSSGDYRAIYRTDLFQNVSNKFHVEVQSKSLSVMESEQSIAIDGSAYKPFVKGLAIVATVIFVKVMTIVVPSFAGVFGCIVICYLIVRKIFRYSASSDRNRTALQVPETSAERRHLRTERREANMAEKEEEALYPRAAPDSDTEGN